MYKYFCRWRVLPLSIPNEVIGDGLVSTQNKLDIIHITGLYKSKCIEMCLNIANSINFIN